MGPRDLSMTEKTGPELKWASWKDDGHVCVNEQMKPEVLHRLQDGLDSSH
jgi:hypothetical protein